MKIKRRRFLTMSAAASVAGLSPSARASAPVAVWKGTALGAESRIVISELSQEDARETFDRVASEIERLESIFSLFRTESELTILNQTGELEWPSPELLTVLSFSRSVWLASGGAFDPTVQPLWQARFAQTSPAEPTHTSFADLEFTGQHIRFNKPGMAITLNGIAQGYITDRVSETLQRSGLFNTAVNTGETLVSGTGPNGTGWRVGLQGSDRVVRKTSTKTNRAFATSAPGSMMFPDGASHILDGRNGSAVMRRGALTVCAPNAAFADALSTAACCLTSAEVTAMLGQFPDTSIIQHR